MEDPNVRQITICKRGYSVYCARCNYRIKAEWNKSKGFEYGMINVFCCMNCGQHRIASEICPHGIGYDDCLGEQK